MAYSPSLLRVPCSADCTCRQMDPITLRNLVCYDSRIMNDMAEIENPHDDDIEDEDLQFDMDIFSYSFFHQQPLPWGVTFKFPQWVIKNHPLPENTLQKSAFKVVATLVENMVRRRYSHTRYIHRCPPTVLNFHWEQFREAEQNFNTAIQHPHNLCCGFITSTRFTIYGRTHSKGHP